MPDMEKVIKCLEQFRADLKPFCGNHADWERFDAALALLKEQESVTVISVHRNGFGSRVGACPNCQSVLHYEYNQSFCGKCGQAVKWDA